MCSSLVALVFAWYYGVENPFARSGGTNHTRPKSSVGQSLGLPVVNLWTEKQLPNVHDKPASEWLGWLDTQEQTALATNALLVCDSKRKLIAAQNSERAKPADKARRLAQYKQAEADYKSATESATFALISALGELHTDAVMSSQHHQE